MLHRSLAPCVSVDEMLSFSRERKSSYDDNLATLRPDFDGTHQYLTLRFEFQDDLVVLDNVREMKILRLHTRKF
jgi:hypothetical protein